MTNIKFLAVVMVLGLGSACNIDLSNFDFGDGANGSNYDDISVDINKFEKIKEDSTFGPGPSYTDLLAISDGILYTAGSSRIYMWSWKIDQGNIAAAWKQTQIGPNFVGNAPANFDLSNGTRSISKLAAIKGGVAVGVSNNIAPAPPALAPATHAGGVAIFKGQNTSAQQTVGLYVYYPQTVKIHHDIVESNAADLSQAIYVISSSAAANHYVSWFKLSEPENFTRGYTGGNYNTSSLKFDDGLPGTVLDHATKRVQAASMLPDGRVALATSQGLLTIKKASVGVKNNADPRLEQDNPANYLDAKHVEQFSSDGLTMVGDVGAMRLVNNKYLLISFMDDGKGIGGFRAADATVSPMVFSSNIAAPKSRVRQIAVGGDEARLVSDDVVYAFRDGLFSVELESSKLKSNTAYLSKGFSPSLDEKEADINTFKGGHVGFIPDDGTKFYEAANHGEFWFYATDQGLFKVSKTKESRKFNKKTGKAL